MRKPTIGQINRWTDDAVYYERTNLPADHPRHLYYGGGALGEVRRNGQNGISRLSDHGLYNAEDIKKRAWGDVDLEQVRRDRRDRAEQKERRDLAARLDVLSQTAPLEKLRAAVAMLEGTQNQ